LNWKAKQNPKFDSKFEFNDSNHLNLVDGLGALVAWLKNGLEELAAQNPKRLPRKF
jgi:hypothetical protein